MNITLKVCWWSWPGTPKKLSCTHLLVARTTTLSPSAIKSSIVNSCSIGPICRKSSRIPSGPEGSPPGGPPCIVQVGAVISQSSSILCSLMSSSHRRAINLLSSVGGHGCDSSPLATNSQTTCTLALLTTTGHRSVKACPLQRKERASTLEGGLLIRSFLGNSASATKGFSETQCTCTSCWTVSPRSVKSTKPNQATLT